MVTLDRDAKRMLICRNWRYSAGGREMPGGGGLKRPRSKFSCSAIEEEEEEEEEESGTSAMVMFVTSPDFCSWGNFYLDSNC